MLFDWHLGVCWPQKHSNTLVTASAWDVDAIEPGIDDCGLYIIEPFTCVITATG